MVVVAELERRRRRHFEQRVVVGVGRRQQGAFGAQAAEDVVRRVLERDREKVFDAVACAQGGSVRMSV